MKKILYENLYSMPKVSMMVSDYAETMLRATNPLLKMEGRKLLNYWNVIKDDTFMIDRIPNLLNQLDYVIKNAYPIIPFDIEGRIKHLFSTNNKVELIEDQTMEGLISKFTNAYLKKEDIKNKTELEFYKKVLLEELRSDGFNKAKSDFVDYFLKALGKNSKNPFDVIRDFFAFRIIIPDSGNGDMINECYQFLNTIIDYVTNETSFEVVKPTKLATVEKLKVSSPLIHIPEKTGLAEENIPYVKDYILHPKSDGYQSLHICLFDPYTSQFFELQVRTKSMDIISETLARHDEYKEKKYGHKQKEVEEKVDFSRIKLENNRFRYFQYKDSEGNTQEYLYDAAGITRPFKFTIHSIDELQRFITEW